MEQLTKQEIFDTVSQHLLKQNARSKADIGGCLYRGPNGLKCAVGCLITDEEYRPCMDGIALMDDGKYLAQTGITNLIRHDLFPKRFDSTRIYVGRTSTNS